MGMRKPGILFSSGPQASWWRREQSADPLSRGNTGATCEYSSIYNLNECVVVDAVTVEPVSLSNSLLTGKRTGNSQNFETFAELSCLETPGSPAVPREFPKNQN